MERTGTFLGSDGSGGPAPPAGWLMSILDQVVLTPVQFEVAICVSGRSIGLSYQGLACGRFVCSYTFTVFICCGDLLCPIPFDFILISI